MLVNFSNYFEALAAKHGEREALVNVERGRRYTFRELHLLTNRIANMMRETLRLGSGDCYYLALNNDNLSLLHFPTIFKGAATAAFGNYRDSLQEHVAQIAQVRPKVVFLENTLLSDHYDPIRATGATIVCMDALKKPRESVLSFWDLVESASDANPDIEIDDRDHITLIRFTGGTTSSGKPAGYSLDNWIGSKDSFYGLPDADWTSSTRALHMAPISHGTCCLFLPGFFMGGCNVTLNEPDLVRYCEVMASERITTTFAVPTMLYRILEMPGVDSFDLTKLNNLYYGAAPMSPAKLKQLQDRFGNIFIQAYASTENCAFALSLEKTAHLITKPEEQGRLASAGQVTPGCELRIVDDAGHAVAEGEVGEIWLRSRGTIVGYFDCPDLTAAEFTNGFWKSGDLARCDADGFVYIVDRKKDMIISGGFNIYAIEVEAAISSHAAVLMCAVVGIPHDDWGEAVHAEVVLRPDTKVEAQALIDHARDQLGHYKAPKTVSFVENLPVSAVGKVLRRDVRNKYWSGKERSIG